MTCLKNEILKLSNTTYDRPSNLHFKMPYEQVKFIDGTYYGETDSGNRQGTGVMEYLNNDVFIGEWHADKKLGRGVFITDVVILNKLKWYHKYNNKFMMKNIDTDKSIAHSCMRPDRYFHIIGGWKSRYVGNCIDILNTPIPNRVDVKEWERVIQIMTSDPLYDEKQFYTRDYQHVHAWYSDTRYPAHPGYQPIEHYSQGGKYTYNVNFKSGFWDNENYTESNQTRYTDAYVVELSKIDIYTDIKKQCMQLSKNTNKPDEKQSTSDNQSDDTQSTGDTQSDEGQSDELKNAYEDIKAKKKALQIAYDCLKLEREQLARDKHAFTEAVAQHLSIEDILKII